MPDRWSLSFRRPAQRWTEALPLGNGTLAAMCHGGIGREVIRLNDDTFWSGRPTDWDVPAAREAVARARRELLDDRPAGAGAALRRGQGPFVESFLPLGTLSLEFDHGETGTSGYERRLELGTATAHTRYDIGGVGHRRRSFVSAPAGVLVVRLDCDRPGALGFRLVLHGPLPSACRPLGEDCVGLTTKAPAHVVPHYVESTAPVVHDERLGHGMWAAVVARVITDGVVTGDGIGLTITAASAATVVLSSATGFRGYAEQPTGTPEECVAAARRRVDDAVSLGADRIERDHVAEHAGWFDRVTLSVPAAPPTPDLPTDELLRRAATDESAAVALAVLLFHYGRYLLIASSRPGSQPANLQGVWNRHVRPPWSSNYTLNINTQMNYWAAEPAGLPELHQPLLDFVSGLAATGTRTARRSYGLPGWVAHHNSDVWRHSMAVGEGAGDPRWANWWMGGAWLSHHLWEHYDFSRCRDELAAAYPVLRGCAQFLLAWLVEDDAGGLTTAPSTSPENLFRGPDGSPCSVTVGATMDLALVAQVFADLDAAAAALGEDDEDELLTRVAAARRRLARPRIGSRGQLLEWADEPVELDPHHRHVSHLVGVFPGDTLTRDPALLAAARVSLDERGDASTGWSLAWKANLWAKLGDGERAWRLVRRFCSEVTTEEFAEDGGVYANLLCAHPPFQIDGNLGLTSALCQMLLDSTGARLRLLPALPAALRSGSVSGLRARGGYTVDIAWSDGRLVAATITATVDGSVRVECADRHTVLDLAAGTSCRLGGELAPRPAD